MSVCFWSTCDSPELAKTCQKACHHPEIRRVVKEEFCATCDKKETLEEAVNREEFENFCKTSYFFKLGDDGVFEKLIVDDSKL